MNTEIITEESIGKYLKLLRNEEIFGILDGRISGIGACDDETDLPQGILTAEIHMDYIRIRRIHVLPEYREGDTAHILLHVVMDLPEDLKMPFMCYGTEDEIDTELLSEYGFKEISTDYSWIEGLLANYKEIKAPPKAYEVGTLDKAPMDRVQRFVLESNYDKLLQIPDGYLEGDRFSDASLVCMDRNTIVSVILMEETDDTIRIPYMHTKNNLALLYALFVLRKLLNSEYESKARLQFLMHKGIGREAIRALIHPGYEKKIRVFRYE